MKTLSHLTLSCCSSTIKRAEHVSINCRNCIILMITVGSSHISKRRGADFSVIGWALSRVRKKILGSDWIKKKLKFYRKKLIHNSPSLPTVNTDVEILSCNTMWLLWSLADSLRDQNFPSRTWTHDTSVAYTHKKGTIESCCILWIPVIFSILLQLSVY
jgi:hypothetical protein